MSVPSVLVLEPESAGAELVTAAIARGFRAQVFDHRPLSSLQPPIQDAVATGQAEYRTVDTRSVELTVQAARELDSLAGVVPGFEYTVPAAAAVARALGLPGLSSQAATVLREKDRMKAALRAAGLPVAEGVPFSPFDDDEQIAALAAGVGFPAVVKPVDGSGSQLVRRVDGPGDLDAYVRECRTALSPTLGRLIGGRLLLERYVSGPEFSVEGYVSGAEVTVVAVTGKLLGAEPHFPEIGHVVDADLPPQQRRALVDSTVAAVRALGLTLGVFHLEARLSPDGPVTIEIGARMPGDRIPRLVREVHGVDLADVMIRCHTGAPVGVPETGRFAAAAIRFFTVDHEAVLTDVEALTGQLSALPGCTELVFTVSSGARLMPLTDWSQRFGRIIVAGADRDRVNAALAEAERLVSRAAVPAVGVPQP